MQNKLKIDFHLVFPFALTLLLWVVFYFDFSNKLSLHDYGVWPRSLKGIPGIITHFFIHGNFNHILSNTISFLVLSLLLFVSYREIAFKIFMWMVPLTGAGLWLIGRKSVMGVEICHIGASGIIFSLFGFLLLSGLIRKNKRMMALTALVIFLYGYMVWGIFPTTEHISWEGHLAGLIAGLSLAVLYRKKGPQPDLYKIQEEEEEEENIPDEEKYWLHTDSVAEEKTNLPPERNDVIFINYNYLPKNPNDGKTEDKSKDL
jgi:membrane associated rhomboid family serine protease